MINYQNLRYNRNKTHFDELLAIVDGMGTRYNPGRTALKREALHTLQNKLNDLFTQLNDTAARLRELNDDRLTGMGKLKSLSIRVMNALQASEVDAQAKRNARFFVNKIAGRRPSKAVGELAADPPVAPTEVDPSTSATRRKARRKPVERCDDMLLHFSRLLAVLKSEPNYTPNEQELTTAGLNDFYNQLNAINTGTVDQDGRFKTIGAAIVEAMNDSPQGLVTITSAVKAYLLSDKEGRRSAEYNRAVKLAFLK